MAGRRRGSITTLEERVAKIFKTGDFADVEFLVGSGEKAKLLSAHKVILSMGSPVFASMFRYPDKIAIPIRVPDIKPTTFSKMLRYLYTDDLSIEGNREQVLDLRHAAKKYRIHSLRYACNMYLQSLQLTPKTRRSVSETAVIFGVRTVEGSSVTITSNLAIDILKSEEFLNSKQETVRMILELDETSVSSEFELFAALLAWGRAECRRKNLEENSSNVRIVVEPLIPCIRFLEMSIEEFTRAMNEAEDMFDCEEILAIYMKIANLKTNQFKSLPSWCNTAEYRRIVSSDVLDTCSENYHQILHPNVLKAKQKVAIIQVRSFKNIVIKGIKLRWIGPDDRRDHRERPLFHYILEASNQTTGERMYMESLLTAGEDTKLIFTKFIPVTFSEEVHIKIFIDVRVFKYLDFIYEQHFTTSHFDLTLCSNIQSSQFEMKQLIYFFKL